MSHFIPDRRPRPEPESMALSVLYADASLLAVDKPPGMVVHPTYRNWSGTLLNGVLWWMGHRPGRRSEDHAEPGIVTRLDKDTSGIVLVALTPELHARMQRDGTAGRMRKEYLAVVEGVPVPDRGAIVLPLARSAEDRRRVTVTDKGQACETAYQVLSSSSGRALVRCELVTGRTHQIRVHLAASGWPIVGDRAYGTTDEHMTRQALHAWRVALPHPVTGARLEIEAGIPSDLQHLIAAQNLTL